MLPILGAVLAAAALAGALVTAMVTTSDARRSKALAEKTARENFTLPLVFVNGLAKWKTEMNSFLRSLQPQLDACDPKLRTIDDKVLAITVDGPGTPGCLGLIDNVMFTSGELSKPTIIYNYAGASRHFTGPLASDGSFDFELTQSRNTGPNAPIQNFTGQLRGVLTRGADGVAISDGVFSGIIDDGRGTCSFAFNALEKAS
ncbi:MAG: hypothetical protein Q8K63_04370 [Acidimicrobiales bacterium]|nr:hypothetical protein [Acidimicrobiales bacterium]